MICRKVGTVSVICVATPSLVQLGNPKSLVLKRTGATLTIRDVVKFVTTSARA